MISYDFARIQERILCEDKQGCIFTEWSQLLEVMKIIIHF